jgi:hypothetical protein
MEIDQMKYLLSLLLISNLAYAESFGTSLEVGCEKTDKLIEAIKSSDYREKMHWGGQMPSDQSVFSLWVNESTKSWTILKSSINGYSCIMGAGTESKVAESETI